MKVHDLKELLQPRLWRTVPLLNLRGLRMALYQNHAHFYTKNWHLLAKMWHSIHDSIVIKSGVLQEIIRYASFCFGFRDMWQKPKINHCSANLVFLLKRYNCQLCFFWLQQCIHILGNFQDYETFILEFSNSSHQVMLTTFFTFLIFLTSGILPVVSWWFVCLR